MAPRTMKELQKLSPELTSRPASDVKDHWRDVVADANILGEIFVTHYYLPEVLVVSLDRYTQLRTEAAANDPFTTLRAELDQELAFLRHPQTAAALRDVFGAGTDELARAANAAASRKS